MKDSYKLAFLIIVFVASMMPLVYFLFTQDSDDMQFISQLLWGKAHTVIDVPNNKLMIVSHIVLGISQYPLTYVIEIILSAIVFLISLGLIARLLYKTSFKQRKGNMH